MVVMIRHQQSSAQPRGATSRADLHCHSTASEFSRLGCPAAVGMPECATPPEEVYALAKRRGMDFVTITDHDTIDGVLSIADRPDVFISEELTASFRGEPQAVHVLCYDITPADHEWLQANRGDVEACAHYMRERGITAALAHPYYQVAAPLTRRHRRRLAELFDIWEVRNGRALGGAQPPVGDLRRHARRNRDRGQRRPRRRRHRPHVHRDACRCDAGRVPRQDPRGRSPGARRAGQRREVGPRRDRAGRALARAPGRAARPRRTRRA